MGNSLPHSYMMKERKPISHETINPSFSKEKQTVFKQAKHFLEAYYENTKVLSIPCIYVVEEVPDLGKKKH